MQRCRVEYRGLNKCDKAETNTVGSKGGVMDGQFFEGRLVLQRVSANG